MKCEEEIKSEQLINKKGQTFSWITDGDKEFLIGEEEDIFLFWWRILYEAQSLEEEVEHFL